MFRVEMPLQLRVHVQPCGTIGIRPFHGFRQVASARLAPPFVVSVTKYTGGRQIGTEGDAVHPRAIAVGANGSEDMRAVIGIAETPFTACGNDVGLQGSRHARAERVVVDTRLITLCLAARAGTADGSR